MKLEIVTPEQIVFSGEVSLVTVPGTMGQFTILENHAPIISSLGKGSIIYKVGDAERSVFTTSGFIEVNNNIVSIAIEVAE